MIHALLELRHISKSYNGRPLLKDISFTVKAGETLCLLGASGSGKSTLLRIISGLESADQGSVLFNGRDLAHTPPHVRDFGMVFQDYALFPHLNVFDNIAFGLRMQTRGPSEIKERVANLLDQVNLAGFENRKINDLSGGEQQRVALARALAPRPCLLMFDEPLGALDRTLKEGLLGQLRELLRRTKVPAIYVTHDQEEAFSIADRIALLQDGLIVRQGIPQEVWEHPGSAWAARFLGIGNIVDGIALSTNKVKTDLGTFDLQCKHKHLKGEKISLLLTQVSKGGREIKLKVKDVLFQQDGFEIHAKGGLVFHRKERPRMGEIIRVAVEVECLV
jgi:ABC-type Fe3+/spermidine/putrescine transport system ATPase subunit